MDRFSADYNKQLPRFNSRFWNPGTEAIDAFTQDWSSENNWLCPPVCLIARALHKLRECKACGTLIAPEWPSSHFWPLLSPNLGFVSMYIRAVKYFNPANDISISRRGQELVYKHSKSVFSGIPRFRMGVFRLDFSREQN